MLAKAMAGESDVTFLTAEGNQFLKSRIGAGSDEVHKLFTAARKYAPSIIFIDEIDAVGKDRNSSMGETTGDVLTAFLTEMDGFKNDTSKPVFVLAATNYEVEQGKGKTLDPALLRRFDRRIYVDLPNRDERRRYLEMKISRHGNAELSDAQIDNIAMRSTGMSLAELESVFEMALRNAIRTGGRITDESFEEAFETFSSGEKKEWAPETLLRTARHEAGHALLCWLYGEKPSYLTIVARGDHGGYMQHGDSEDKAIYLKSELAAKIRTALAGRAAELVYYGDEDGISTGASADLYSATKTCERMICNYGMDDDFGLSYIDVSSMDIDTASDMRARVNEVLAAELALARETVAKNAEAMDKIVAALMEKNHLKGGEIDEIFSKYAIK
jgi:ATP-dependent Zn protease